MPLTWENALKSYRYPVVLQEFEDAHQFPGRFIFEIGDGDRAKTIGFESHFRACAQHETVPWLEVVFWKLFSQGGRANVHTRKMAKHFKENGISAEILWARCNDYVAKPTRSSFESFRQLLGFNAPVIAVAATFPAFIKPETYPMVDTRIAKWVGKSIEVHTNNFIDKRTCGMFGS